MQNNNNLPKSWAVRNDGSQKFKDIVIKYIKENDHSTFWNGVRINHFYCYHDGENKFIVLPLLITSHYKILTIDEFSQCLESKKTSITDTMNKQEVLAQLKLDCDAAYQSALDKIKSLESVKQEPYRWQPNIGDKYWYIAYETKIEHFIWSGGSFGKELFKALNIFQTKAEAQKERDIRQLWIELRQFAKEKNNIQGKVIDRYSSTIYGVKFIADSDIDLAYKHFGSRLDLLDNL